MRGLSLILLVLLAACESPKELTLPKADAYNGGLVLANGFGALIVADSVGPSRHLAVNHNGDIYVKLRLTSGNNGNVALRDTNGDGKADIIQRFGDYPNDGTFATDMRIHNGYLYFSSELVVYRQKLEEDRLIPRENAEVIVTDRHPIHWHNAKTLAFDGRGNMFVTFSAPTNVCEDWTSNDYATTKSTANVKGYYPCPELNEFGGIWKFEEDKLNQSQFDGKRIATGVRSVVAMAWNNEDNNLYAINHGRDYLYSHAPEDYTQWENAVLPAEEFMLVKEGENYGWPYTYFDPFRNKRMMAPEYGGNGELESNEKYADPIMSLPAHWAPNDLLFYSGDQFPERYRYGAFVAFHGSTNRLPYAQGGYIVAFVPFKDGKPTGTWEVFADGFTGVDVVKEMKYSKFRPMGLSEGPDGSLYISESKNGRIWRVMFTGDRKTFGDTELSEMEKRKMRSYIRQPEVGDSLSAVSKQSSRAPEN